MTTETRYNVHTFGCKVNTYDTGLIEARLGKAGFRIDPQDPEVYILNTCAVTGESTKEAQRWVRRIKVKNPFALVVVTGCAAQVDTDKFSSLAGVDLVVANSHKGQLNQLIRKLQMGELKERVYKSNIFKKMDLEEGGGVENRHTRAFLKIQDGCNSFCTYCVIPFARGKSRSLSVDSLVRRVNELVSQGVKEIVLAGVHIGDYCDIDPMGAPYGLEGLIEQLLKNTRIERLRTSSLEPVEITDRLMELFKEDRVCPHFHMSIQSACSKTLSDMKRNYGAEAVESSLERVAREVPQAFVGMDVITGFPGESPEDFQETYDRLKNLPWTKIHVFPYSERPGTYASRLTEKNTRQVVMERARDLREMSWNRYAEKALSQVGTIKRVLTLKSEAGVCHGLSRDYWPVQLPELGSSVSAGREMSVQIQGFDYSQGDRKEGSLVGISVIDAFR